MSLSRLSLSLALGKLSCRYALVVDDSIDLGLNRKEPAAAGSPFVLSDQDEARIRQAARDALSRSFSILTDERVLPRNRYRPWIHMARDYFGHAVEGSEGALSRALAEALPDRFEWRRGKGVDLPWYYPSALLEGAIAAATLNDEPYDVDSPSVDRSIDELIATVQAVPRSTVIQVVADVDVEHALVPEGHRDRLGETVEISGVRIVRVENQPERFIERELASAGYEVERSDVFVHPGPASLLVAEVQLMADYEQRVAAARRRLNLLIAAIRLATASTVHSVMDIAGNPGRLPTIGPAITPFPSWGFRFVHRPVTIGARDVGGYEALVSLIDSWGDEPSWVPVRIALGRLGRSLDGRTPGIVDQVVDLAIGLEAALAGTDKSEISLRLRSRAAALLATPDDPPDAIYRDVKTLYELRSTFVHGGSLPGKDLDKALKRVTGATVTEWPAEQYLLALDRWRDILRRAVLARIALASAVVPWLGGRAGQRIDVDELLLRERDRDEWRQHVQLFWADRGLPNTARPAQTASLTIGGKADRPADAE